MLIDDLATHWNDRLGAMGLASSGYYYDAQLAVNNFERMQDAVGEEVELLLSLKANPNVELNRRLLEKVVAGLDVSGLGELALAKELEALTRSVSLVGPGKSEQLLESALSLPVSQIVFESEAEITRVARLHADSLQVARLLRINPTGAVIGANEVMSGGPSQFGVDEEDAPSLIERITRSGRLDGLHFFRGSQIRETELVVQGIQYAVQTGLALADACDLALVILSVGGGLGVPHRRSDAEIELRKLNIELAEVWRELRSRHPGIRIQMEVGRYVYADAGVYVTRVLEVKQSRGTTFVIVANGVSGFSRRIVTWGEAHPLWKLGDSFLDADDDAATPHVIVGPTCLPGDVISDEAWLRDPKEGDVIVVGNAGAYGFSMSLTSWGSVGKPCEIVI